MWNSFGLPRRDELFIFYHISIYDVMTDINDYSGHWFDTPSVIKCPKTKLL